MFARRRYDDLVNALIFNLGLTACGEQANLGIGAGVVARAGEGFAILLIDLRQYLPPAG
jgi:hypothetical protein